MPKITPEEMRAISARKRAEAIQYKKDKTISIHIGGLIYEVSPAIGSTGCAKNVGWELVCTSLPGYTLYYASKESSVAAIRSVKERIKAKIAYRDTLAKDKASMTADGGIGIL